MVSTATVLPNGTVLVAGGMTGTFTFTNLSSAGAVRSRCGQMDADPRHDPWTRLPHGDVAAQWQGPGRGVLNRHALIPARKLYDPATGTWTATGALSQRPRCHHTATLLPNGKVLVAGGWGGSQCLSFQRGSCTIRRTGSGQKLAPLTTARENHTATLLPNGKVLVAGAITVVSFSFQRGAVRSGHRVVGADWHLDAAPRLAHGDVAVQWPVAAHRKLELFFPNQRFLNRAELYDPATESWAWPD